MPIQVLSNLLCNGLTPVSTGGSGTSLKLLPQLPGASIGVASTKNGYVYCPDNGQANGQRMQAIASGDFTIGGGPNFTSPAVTVALYFVTFAGNVPAGLATIGGQTVAPYTGATTLITQTFVGSSDVLAAGYPWALSVDLMGSQNSGLVQTLSGSIAIDGVAGSFSASVPGSGINFNSAIPFALVVGVTSSVSDTSFLANMFEFQLIS